ncbi:DUF4421 domain-containing protein [Chitinophaga rhizophila]|uniref:DUF4421 domain-containing protein n=1 Tax=Chitinophaga rhizophila TaxID=2866212 RepID=A0ABS7G8E0_9BACT|nr:DUF4421 domain-containing protein [Chitinophaga rhizophila]MBW8683933.1 DUF4421 domain-containing protein [Chitinophaga rhizophila]
MLKWLALLTACLLICVAVSAQHTPFFKKAIRWLEAENDSNYIEEHTEDLTVRLFGSRKYNNYDIVDNDIVEGSVTDNGVVNAKSSKDVLYRPNTPFNVGFGFNYRFLAINLAFNLSAINKESGEYGKTKMLDLQTHIYTRRLVVDFYGQIYNGYYIANTRQLISSLGTNAGSNNVEMIRPDARNVNIGLNVQYIFNSKRFSYRAAYLQNDYQKKSAGSFLVGGEVFGVRMKGDSGLIPSYIQSTGFFNGENFNRTRIISAAANAGYAHTFVYKQHWFTTLSLSGSLGVNHTIMNRVAATDLRKIGLQFNNNVRISVGYNSSRYFAGIHYVYLTTRSQSPVPDTYQTMGAGNFRVSLARRFTLKKPLF